MARVAQAGAPGDGVARVVVDGLAADPGRRIGVQDAAGRWLDPSLGQWHGQPTLFPPHGPADAGALAFDLPAGITRHLVANAQYLLRVDGVDAEIRCLMPRDFRYAADPVGWSPPPSPAEPQATTQPEPQAVTQPEPPLPPAPPPLVMPERRASYLWVATLTAALVAIGATWLFLDERPADPSRAPVTTPAPPAAPTLPAPNLTLDGARRALAADPAAGDARALADRHLDARSLDGAFLLYRHAAERGDGEAALAVGRMYDPMTHGAATSPLPAPNPDQALVWYRKAADAAVPEAEFRLAELLLSGKVDVADGPEQAVPLLRRAAERGHEPARRKLAELEAKR
jgi:hypothetical protein